MKIYDMKQAPRPRLLRIFLAEKGLTENCEFIQVDLMNGEQHTESFKKKNPSSTVPVLELDNGQYLAESISICRYFEAQEKKNPLFGENAEDAALIDMWLRRVESGFFQTTATYFHQGTDGLGDERYRNKDWGLENLRLLKQNLKDFEGFLAQRPYAAGDHYSIVDITLLCALDFAQHVGAIDLADYPVVATWHNKVSSRESAKA